MQDVGIAVAAVASTIAAVIGILRFVFEQRHLVVRLSVSQPDAEDPTSAYVSASIFNQGRLAYIEAIAVRAGKDWFGLTPVGNELPAELPTSRSLRAGSHITRLEEEFEQMADAYDQKIEHTSEDWLKVRLRVIDGEGHEHWASPSPISKRNLRALVANRTAAQHDSQP